MPDVLMPRLSDTMEEGTLSQWVKQQGEQVHRGDVLAVIETDKASMELEAYDEGVLTRVLVPEGETVPIGAPIAVIGESGDGTAQPASPQEAPAAGALSEQAPAEQAWEEQTAADQAPPGQPPPPRPVPSQEAQAPAAQAQAPASQVAPASQEAPAPAPPEGPVPPAPAPKAAGDRIRTSPLARARAREHGIDLATIAGSGPGGRIVRADVDAAIAQQAGARPAAERLTASPLPPSPPAAPAPPTARPAAQPPAAAEHEDVPLTRVRQLTAQRLAASAREAPHFYLNTVVDAGPLLAFRAEANQRVAGSASRISVTDLLVRACALTLRAHPEANASWAADHIVRHHRVNVGVAVALDDGLIVPVIRDADRKTLTEIAAEAKDLAARARAGRVTLEEISGGTFTISNLGMYGIDHFTAVINPPEAAILAVGAATSQPVVRDGQVVAGTTMKLTLSIDHRVLDGATGAVFLAGLKAMLEEPLTIVL